VLAQIPTERGLMERDSVEFSASLKGMGRAYMRIPSEPIRNQRREQGRAFIALYNIYEYIIRLCTGGWKYQ